MRKVVWSIYNTDDDEFAKNARHDHCCSCEKTITSLIKDPRNFCAPRKVTSTAFELGRSAFSYHRLEKDEHSSVFFRHSKCISQQEMKKPFINLKLIISLEVEWFFWSSMDRENIGWKENNKPVKRAQGHEWNRLLKVAKNIMRKMNVKSKS
mgnify:CR=1 FL=1